MSYSILRVAKVKGSNNTRGIQKHCQRENKNYQNKDINSEKTHMNYDLVNDEKIDFNQKINERIEAGYHGKRKIRSDAIRHIDGIITSDSDFFEDKSQEEKDAFFKDSLKFLEKEYGKENIIYASVHYDEKTPHMHFGFVPLTNDGRLSAKEKLGNKKNLSELQNRFSFHISIDKGYDLKRGSLNSRKEHKTVEAYKSETKYHEKETELAKQESERVKAEQKKAEKEFEKLKEQLQKDIDRLNQKPDFKVEDEVLTEKNIFGKVTSIERTGRVIMSNVDFEKVKEKYLSATRILDDYETLKNTDVYKENQGLRKEKEVQNKRAQEWMNESFKHERKAYDLEEENEQLKEKNKELNDFSKKMVKNTAGVYKALRSRYKGFEERYNEFADSLAQKERTEPLSRFMKEIQGAVHEQDRKKSRSNDLEL
ncbi:MobV family relaxase [Salinicoccus jeotgali]|uniref:Mobilization protein n=2 Tax=Salinicoccus jeotgali TaxID=381634 RepID=A0ABP7EWZ4_9STAP